MSALNSFNMYQPSPVQPWQMPQMNWGPNGQLVTPSMQVAGGAAGPGAMSWEGAFGQMGENGWVQGWAMPALQTFGGLANVYLGMKQYGLAKDQFKESKRQFNLNFDAQRKLTNSRLRDRQRARVASNPNAYQSVGAYMKDNGI